MTGLRDALRAGKTQLLGVNVCFRKREAFESMLWIQIALTNAGGHHPIPCGSDGTKMRRMGEFAHPLLDLGSPYPRPWKWHPWFSDWIAPTFLVVQFADSRRWDFSASVTMWANSCNTSPQICVYLYTPIGSVWRILTLQLKSKEPRDTLLSPSLKWAAVWSACKLKHNGRQAWRVTK